MAGRGRGMTTPAWMTQGVRPAEQAAPGGLQAPYLLPQQPPTALPPPYPTMYGGGPPPPPYGALPPPGGPYPPPGQPQFPLPPAPFPSYSSGPPGGGGGYPSRPPPFDGGDSDRRRRRGRSADGGDDSTRKKPFASSRVGGSDRTTLRARRLYVKGTENLTERELKDFFNSILRESAGIENGALAVTVNEKNFSFVEFSEVEVMHAFLEMSAIPYKGRVLLLQKPRDYELLRPLGQILYLDLSRVTNPDLTTSMLPKSTKVKLMGLSPSMSEITVAELLAPFGELVSSPSIVKDPRTGRSEGVAFAEFADPNSADAAVRKHSLTSSTGELVTVVRAPPVSDERSGSASRPRDIRPPRRDSPSAGRGRGGHPFPSSSSAPHGGGPPGSAPYYNPAGGFPPPLPPPQGAGPYFGGGMPPPYGGGGGGGSYAPPLPSGPYPPPSQGGGGGGFPYPPPPGGGGGGPPPPGDPRLPPGPIPPPYGGGGGGLPPMFANNQPPPSYAPPASNGGGGLPPPYGSQQGPPPPQGPPQQQMPYGGSGYGQPQQGQLPPPQQQQQGPPPPSSYYGGPPPQQQQQQQGPPPPQQYGSGPNGGGPGYLPAGGPPPPSSTGYGSSAGGNSSSQPTAVLLLLNMVTREELANQEDYQEIFEDTEGEARKFGAVERVVIPRSGPGIERVFIQYKSPIEAKAAFQALNGRKFSHRTVEARFYNEDTFAVGNLGM